MKKWEYLFLQFESRDRERDKKVNEAGKIGWELVSVSCTDFFMHYFFKRELI